MPTVRPLPSTRLQAILQARAATRNARIQAGTHPTFQRPPPPPPIKAPPRPPPAFLPGRPVGLLGKESPANLLTPRAAPAPLDIDDHVGKRVIELPVETNYYDDDYLLVDHVYRGARGILLSDVEEGIQPPQPSLPGLAARGVTVTLNWIVGPSGNYAIASHGLNSQALHVTLLTAGAVFLAPWGLMDENRIEIHVQHGFFAPSTAVITALIP